MKDHSKAAALIIVFVLFSIYTTLVCFAASNTYHIPETEMTIELPDNIIAAAQGIKANDDLFDKDKGGWDYIKTMSEMRENGDYLLGKPSDNSYKLEVKISDNSDGIKNLCKLSDKKRSAFYDSIRSQSDVFEVAEKQINSIQYAGVVRNTKLSDIALYSYEYVTVADSKNITVKITSYNDRLTNDETKLLENAVSSIVFSNADAVHTVPKIGGSIIFAFCVITAGFAFLVICKLNEESVHKILEKIKAARVQHENETKQKPQTATASDTKQETKSDSRDTSDNAEITTGKSFVQEEKAADDKQEKSGDNEETENSEEQEQIYDIDLDEAIANFDDSAEANQRRRNERNNTVKKKKRFV